MQSIEFSIKGYAMNFSSSPLKIRLADWKSCDRAAYELGVVLGLWIDFGGPLWEDPWHGLQYIFWSDNPLGTSLNNMILELTKCGALQVKSNNEAFRWNPDYDEDKNFDDKRSK